MKRVDNENAIKENVRNKPILRQAATPQDSEYRKTPGGGERGGVLGGWSPWRVVVGACGRSSLCAREVLTLCHEVLLMPRA